MRDDPLSPLPDRGLTLLFSFKERSDPLLLSRREEESASCFYIKEKRTHLSPHKEKQGFSSFGKREKRLMPPPQEGPPLFREERGHPCSERRGATLVQRGEGPPHPCSERRGATLLSSERRGAPLFWVKRGHPPFSFSERGMTLLFSLRERNDPLLRKNLNYI